MSSTNNSRSSSRRYLQTLPTLLCLSSLVALGHRAAVVAGELQQDSGPRDTSSSSSSLTHPSTVVTSSIDYRATWLWKVVDPFLIMFVTLLALYNTQVGCVSDKDRRRRHSQNTESAVKDNADNSTDDNNKGKSVFNGRGWCYVIVSLFLAYMFTPCKAGLWITAKDFAFHILNFLLLDKLLSYATDKLLLTCSSCTHSAADVHKSQKTPSAPPMLGGVRATAPPPPAAAAAAAEDFSGEKYTNFHHHHHQRRPHASTPQTDECLEEEKEKEASLLRTPPHSSSDKSSSERKDKKPTEEEEDAHRLTAAASAGGGSGEQETLRRTDIVVSETGQKMLVEDLNDTVIITTLPACDGRDHW
eukprot:GHVQ01022421.1.p1 GENE.GHVQ01022421.1~~GHVQ01022421.1.p1  ORF type:complete len:359 (-),score=91.96 GHVQ01022421.1:799-1875(-)